MPVARRVPNQLLQSEEISVSYYPDEMPTFVEAEMERLYQSLYSSVAYFRVNGSAQNASTYVVRKNGRIITVFLFRHEAEKIRILNEVIRIDAEDIRRFAEFVFSTFKSISVILFNAIQTDIHKFPFPYQRYNHLEDIVLTLPETQEEYVASLGKSTRKTIKGYTNKLNRSFPSFRWSAYTHDQGTEQHVRDIINLNTARMARKNKISAFNERETKRIIDLVKVCGLVCVATIDDLVCAGSISYRIGTNYFMHIAAHDPVYDELRLGTLCCYLTISECIARAGKECHLLWGRQEYKYRLLGVQHDLDHLVVYRSHMQLLLNADVALKTAFRGTIRQLMLCGQSLKRQYSFIPRFAIGALNYLKSVKW